MAEPLANASQHPADSLFTNALRRLKDRLINRYQRTQPILPDADLQRIESMIATVEEGPEAARPSLYWRKLNRMNVDQLRYTGFANFKRTIALNYFTFVNILPWDPQIRALLSTVPVTRIGSCAAKALFTRTVEFYSSVNWLQTRIYAFMTLAMHERLRAMNLTSDLAELSEPSEGGAIPVRAGDGRAISADLCNSIAECHFATSALDTPPGVVLELGGGYGRTAFVWATAKRCKYIMVDIAPALWVAERYMSTIFRDRRVFSWRKFEAFADVEDEFNAAGICFLSPDQLALLPAGMVDLGVNISSLHEMTIDKISYFVSQFDRLIREGGHFYLKAWKESHLPVDNAVIRREDYPVPAHWTVVREDTPIFQPDFFEAVFRKTSS
jgi:putative sugar O-methyltransferase